MFRKRHPPAGAQPGTMVMDGAAGPPTIHVMSYTPDHLDEADVDDLRQLRPLLNRQGTSWVDVEALGDEGVLRGIADIFGMHPLALSDVVNVPQRPKVDPYDGHLFAITRMIHLYRGEITSEQVSLLIGPNFVLTFQEIPGDVFDPIRARIRQGGPIFRSSGPGYLAYAILDAVIDGYYPVLETLGERLEALEDEVLARPTPAALRKIHEVRRELLAIRKAIWPQREALNELIRDPHPLISEKIRVYLRDCYDHCVQIIEVIETYRELAGSLMEMYLSCVGNRQNEVMKVLTIMATIFIPLTFIVGIYGMNFEHMPELSWPWAYPVLLGLMLAIGLAMLVLFHRRGWLGGAPGESQPVDTPEGDGR